MFRKFACLIVMGFFFVPAVALAHGNARPSSAVTAAKKWLQLIDEGNYGATWAQASGYFRKAVTRGKWEHSMEAVRKPLGKMLSRKLKLKEYKTSLPGAPDGQYEVMQFETSFAHKKSAVETVIFMKGAGGRWGAAGYFIR